MQNNQPNLSLNLTQHPYTLPPPVQRIAKVALSPAQSGSTATAQELTLLRLWPQTTGYFRLEYINEQGQHIPGQWVQDTAKFCKIVDQTQKAMTVPEATVVALPESGVILQLGGADRKLTGLAALAAQPHAELLVHQPERRAVVRLRDANGVCYAKVVRPRVITALAQTMQTIHRLAADRFVTPEVLAIDEERCLLILSALAGRSLYDLLSNGLLNVVKQAAAAAGEGLQAFHALPPLASAVPHRATEEVAVVQQWLERLAIVAPDLHLCAQAQARTVSAALLKDESPSVLLHRDFYDKQVFYAKGEPVGLLDFDTLAVGEAALDVGNALAHFELRVLQNHCSLAQGLAAANNFLAGYQPTDAIQPRISAYLDAARLRLACVAACWPAQQAVAAQMLTRVGKPFLELPS